jgi:hypothetical protein
MQECLLAVTFPYNKVGFEATQQHTHTHTRMRILRDSHSMPQSRVQSLDLGRKKHKGENAGLRTLSLCACIL